MPAITLCYSVKFNRSKVDDFVLKYFLKKNDLALFFFTFILCNFNYVLGRTWNIGVSDKDFNYLSVFVETMANLTMDRMYGVFSYAGDNRLLGVNLRELVEFVNILSRN